MHATQVSGRHARIDVSLDGIRFTRSESDAAKRSTRRVRELGWDEVDGATIETSGKGRPIVRVAVTGAAPVGHHGDDPYAVKVSRNMTEQAHDVVERINDEVGARRRWRDHTPEPA